MVGDLKNLRRLAEYLQKTEFKFDLLSSIVELQKQIVNEFDFNLEARNMDIIKKSLEKSVGKIISKYRIIFISIFLLRYYYYFF
jgi:predicted unusual protein kinase regulating ubiquinone biosynthesis (AarF/ABC1/UbiB family)